MAASRLRRQLSRPNAVTRPNSAADVRQWSFRQAPYGDIKVKGKGHISYHWAADREAGIPRKRHGNGAKNHDQQR
jgi:hypothetical protein